MTLGNWNSTTVIAGAVAVSAALFVRLALSFEYPLPWGDEAAFLSQAVALAHHGTLYVEALNPDRILMWMPPGYMVVTAAIFRIFGYSFALARWLSTIFFIGFALVTIGLSLSRVSGWPKLLVLAATITVFVSPYVLFISNIARMDSLYALGLAISLQFAVCGRPVIGGSVVAGLLTVHPNAGYFLPPYAVFALLCLIGRDRPKLVVADWIAAATALVLLLLYGLFAHAQWAGFVSDMSWQFGLKAGRPFLGTILEVIVAGFMALVAVAQICYFRSVNRQVWLTMYGACFFFMALYGQVMVYRFGFSVGLLLVMASIASSLPALPGWAPRLAGAAACLFLLYDTSVYATVPAPNTAPIMVLARKRVVSHDDLKKIHGFIRGLPPASTVSFSYQFNGIEPFFFNDFDASGTYWIMNTYSATQGSPERRTDWRITCDSSLYAPMIGPQFDHDYKRTGADTGCHISRWAPSGSSLR